MKITGSVARFLRVQISCSLIPAAFPGGGDGVDVKVGDPEVWICGGDSDEFYGGTLGRKRVNEGGEVGCKFVVQEIDG